MRVISLRIKFKIFTVLIATLFMCALATVCFKPLIYGDILLAIPKTASALGYSADSFDKMNQEDFRFTYEVRQKQTVSLLNSSYSVNFIGTNDEYPFIMKLTFLGGSFFTKDSFGTNITLNEKAAFDLFGGANIGGNNIMIHDKYYTVSGVVDDGDIVNRNIYLSGEISNESIIAFAVSLDGTTQEYVLNRLNQDGINNTNYTFIALSLMRELLHEKLFIAIQVALCVVILGCLLKYKKRFKYPMQLGLTAVWLGFSMFMVQGFLETCLYWYDTPNLKEFTDESFFKIIEQLRTLWTYSDMFFVAFLLVVAMAVFIWVFDK